MLHSFITELFICLLLSFTADHCLCFFYCYHAGADYFHITAEVFYSFYTTENDQRIDCLFIKEQHNTIFIYLMLFTL